MEIAAYDFGHVEIDHKDYDTDVIVGPERIVDHWWRKEGHRLDIEDLDEILAENPRILIVGTGYYSRMTVPAETRHYLEKQGIELHLSDTRSAVNDFNRLQRQYGRVVAALHLTC